MDKIFKRWNIGDNGRVSFLHCANGSKAKRALRIHLPKNGYLTLTKWQGWQMERLAEVSYNARMRAAVRPLDGGPGYQLDCKRFHEATETSQE